MQKLKLIFPKQNVRTFTLFTPITLSSILCNSKFQKTNLSTGGLFSQKIFFLPMRSLYLLVMLLEKKIIKK